MLRGIGICNLCTASMTHLENLTCRRPKVIIFRQTVTRFNKIKSRWIYPWTNFLRRIILRPTSIKRNKSEPIAHSFPRSNLRIIDILMGMSNSKILVGHRVPKCQSASSILTHNYSKVRTRK